MSVFHLALFQGVVNIQVSFNVEVYLQWLVSALGSKSAQDCQFVYEAQEELLQRQLSVDVVCEPPLAPSSESEQRTLKR